MYGGALQSKFATHGDNDEYLDCNVVTCIFYTQKDSSIINGNLEYYENNTPQG